MIGNPISELIVELLNFGDQYIMVPSVGRTPVISIFLHPVIALSIVEKSFVADDDIVGIGTLVINKVNGA